jgi:XTP/dITP diphosphohydrolase
LEVESLDGEPGVYSARYAGDNVTPAQNRSLLLEKLKGEQNRKARFRTVLTLIKDNRIHQFEGVVTGRIATQETGDRGFGYDSIFIPENEVRSFGEMTLNEKNRFSHRARALEKLKAFLEKS